jgi:hypothetical protein
MSWREYDRFGNQKFIRVSNRRQDVSFDFHNDSDEEFESPSEVQAQTGRKRDKHRSRSAVRGLSPSACQKLADIIGGDVAVTEPARIVQRLRDIDAKILDRTTRSPLALPFALSFENSRGTDTLNLGETVILQKEINPFLSELRKRGIIVTALHNHWLFEEPRLMYIHWENVGDPFEFARNSIEAAKEADLF